MGGPVTGLRPVGDLATAYRRVLARAHRAEAEARRLRKIIYNTKEK